MDRHMDKDVDRYIDLGDIDIYKDKDTDRHRFPLIGNTCGKKEEKGKAVKLEKKGNRKETSQRSYYNIGR